MDPTLPPMLSAVLPSQSRFSENTALQKRFLVNDLINLAIKLINYIKFEICWRRSLLRMGVQSFRVNNYYPISTESIFVLVLNTSLIH